MTDDEMIKCLKCGQILISGRGCLMLFGKGTSLSCQKCGNTYIFGEENVSKISEKTTFQS